MALLARADQRPSEMALLQKLRGKWAETTWMTYAESVADIAGGLHRIGISSGEKVLMLLDNRPALVYLDFAVQALGAVSVLVPPNSLRTDVCELVDRLKPSLVVVQDSEWLDAMLPVLPAGSRLVHVDTAGVAAYRDERMLDYKFLREKVIPGEDTLKALRARVAAVHPETIATLVVSTGARGSFRTFGFTHAQLAAAADATVRQFPLREGEFALSQVPLGIAAERALTVHAAVLTGAVVAFPENASVAAAAAIEIRPHFVHSPTALLDNLAMTSRRRLNRNRGLKRLVAGAWLRKISSDSGAGRISHNLVGRAIVRLFGLERARVLLISDVALSGAARHYLQALKMPLVDAYTTATCAAPLMLSRNPGGGYDCQIPGLETEISERGTLRIRGLLVSSNATDSDGWYDTGDAAQRVDGETFVHGPLNLQSTVPSPRLLTLELTLTQFIRRADLIEMEGSICLLLQLDGESIGAWARVQGLSFSTLSAIVDDALVQQRLSADVEATIRRLGAPVLLDQVVLLRRPLTVEAGELTTSGKVRRLKLRIPEDGVRVALPGQP
jgi:long-chain acyl-CoA synthetase